ncbi:MAG: ASCH domain-containing protein [Pseudomonadota bacterium]
MTRKTTPPVGTEHLSDQRHAAFWKEATSATRCVSANRLADIGWFDDNEEGARFCADAVLSGDKTATSTLAATARSYVPGDLEIVTLFDGTPVALIEITHVDERPFGSIDDAFARLEGDCSLNQWRETHERYYGARLSERGEVLSEDTPLLRIFFRRLYPL